MKSRAPSLLCGAMLAVSAGCFSSEPDKPINLCGGDVSCEEIEGLTRGALDGSPDAALKLFWTSFDEGKMEDALYWAQVAMENGSQAGRHNYASLLIQRGDAKSLARARYHLKILVKQGDKDAIVLLKEAERKQARPYQEP